DALTYAGNLENLRELENDAGHLFVRADIRDGAAMLELMRQHQIEAVVNFAAESHVDRSIMSAAPFLDTNVTGTLRLLEAAREVYNIGAENDCPNLEVVRGILKLTGRDESLIRHVPDRPGHDRRYAMNAAKIRAELGWRPRHTFDEGLAATVAWYRDNPAWA